MICLNCKRDIKPSLAYRIGDKRFCDCSCYFRWALKQAKED